MKEELKACEATASGTRFEDVAFAPDSVLQRLVLTPLPATPVSTFLLTAKMLSGETVLLNVDAGCAVQREAFSGRLVVTNYQLTYLPDDPKAAKRLKLRPEFFVLPLGFISRYFLPGFDLGDSVDKSVDRKTYMAACIDVVAKDLRTFKFLFPLDEKSPTTVDKVLTCIETATFCGDDRRTFAFSHLPSGKPATKNSAGWSIFNDLDEYRRMGLVLDTPVSDTTKAIGLPVQALLWEPRWKAVQLVSRTSGGDKVHD